MDSFLSGLVLVLSTHSGPQYVYHYTPPSRKSDTEETEENKHEDFNESDSSLAWSDFEEDEESIVSITARENIFDKLQNKKKAEPIQPTLNVDDRKAFGFDRDFLAEMLCPPKQLSNRPFELFVDDIIFVGIPVHVHEDGSWRRSKSHTPIDINEQDCPMTMFHVCAVIDPPITRAKEAVKNQQLFIVAPFARMLRHEQASRNYVWEEASKILRIREELADQPTDTVQKAIETESELARAFHVLYDAIVSGGIARLQVGNRARALEIPVQLELNRLPLPTQKYHRGSYLSTAGLPGKEIGPECVESYGLLLLDDPEAIVQEIDVDSQGPVAAMIRSIQPTSSLAAIANEASIDIKEIVNLAYSLVYWRRARIIIPLHHRHVYGISPLAPIQDITKLVDQYALLFPTMPPLQRFLAGLSTGKPQPYIAHVPSRDHRDIYMRVLAWLLQHDIVVHLQTFCVILASRKVKLTVLHQMIEDADQEDESKPKETEESPQHADTATDNTAKRRPNNDRKPSRNNSGSLTHVDIQQESIILDPIRASLLEKKWISHIASTQSPDWAEMFQRLSKYFNGRDCLEQIIMHEGITRVDLRRFLQRYGDHLIIYRHW